MKKGIVFRSVFPVWLFSMTSVSLAANVWTPKSKVSRLQTLSNGNFVVHLDTSNAECQGGGKIYHAYLNQNSINKDGLEKLYANMLLASSSDRLISVRYNNALGSSGTNNSSACFVSEIILEN